MPCLPFDHHLIVLCDYGLYRRPLQGAKRPLNNFRGPLLAEEVVKAKDRVILLVPAQITQKFRSSSCQRRLARKRSLTTSIIIRRIVASYFTLTESNRKVRVTAPQEKIRFQYALLLQSTFLRTTTSIGTTMQLHQTNFETPQIITSTGMFSSCICCIMY
jgi:hypothetical protein